MAGGQSAQSGFTFQDRVAAWIAAHILSGSDSPPVWGLPQDVSLTDLRLETEVPVDDILVKTSTDGWCFINVKSSVDLSDKPESELGSVIDQYVRLWLACKANDKSYAWSRPIDFSKDRLVLATSSKSSKSFINSTKTVIKRIIELGVGTDSKLIAKTLAESKVLDKLTHLIALFWKKHSGSEPIDAEVRTLLSVVRIQVYQLEDGQPDWSAAMLLLGKNVLLNKEDRGKAWSILVKKCAEFARDGSGAGRDHLRAVLRNEGIPLVGVQEYSKDIQAIIDYSDTTKKLLARFSQLEITKDGQKQIVEIERKCVGKLCEMVESQSFLVIGQPGAGKSGALYLATEKLMKLGHPVAYFAVDRLNVRMAGEIDDELRLTHRLPEVLRNWESDKPGVLIIDALDATRGGPSEKVFRELIYEVVTHVDNWRVIASIRKFDLRYGREFQTLFTGAPVASDYLDPEFQKVRHLNIPKLSHEDLLAVWKASPAIHSVYEKGSQAFKDILHSPFNLFLLTLILSEKEDLSRLGGIATQVELLDSYWAARVSDTVQHKIDREKVLRKATETMITNRALFSRKREFDEAKAESISDLLSNNVLAEWISVRDTIDSNRLAFAHHMLFDYAVARLILENGHAPDFVKRIGASDDQALMLAPATTMAFQKLWLEEDESHKYFWDMAIALASEEFPCSLCRILAPRVVVEWICSETDFAPLVTALQSERKKAAHFFIQHLFGVLIADILPTEQLVGEEAGPWATLVLQCAEIAALDLAYPLRNIIVKFVNEPEALANSQIETINKAARLVLAHAITSHPYDRYIVAPLIEAVVVTINGDINASVELLRQILAPDHFAEHAHEELFWLTKNVSFLIKYTPQFLVDVYAAAFGTPPPETNQETSIGGSRILALKSNRQQDYQLSLHQLAEEFDDFATEQPRLAIEALILSIEGYVTQEHPTNDEIQTIRFQTAQIKFQQDHSHVWWSYDEDRNYSDDAVKLLDKFIDGMESVLVAADSAKKCDEVIGFILERNHLACIWTMLLYLGTKHLDAVGRKIIPLLTQSVLLESYDTRKPAGDLVKLVHPVVDAAQKISIERAILMVEDVHARDVLVGCLDGSAIESPDVQSALAELKARGPIPENMPPFRLTTGWGEQDKDWWLKKQGVDLNQESNRSLKDAIEAVEVLKKLDISKEKQKEHLASNWEKLTNLHDLLKNADTTKNALLKQGWDVLAETAEKAAQLSESPKDLSLFLGIESMILEAADYEMLEVEDDTESRYEKSPGWGRPAPRIEAAGALMVLARAKGQYDEKLSNKIFELAKDPHPAVRNQILGRVNALYYADPDLMWSLCDIAFNSEKNQSVLHFFIAAFRHFMKERLSWASEKLLQLADRYRDKNIEVTKELQRLLVQMIGILWLRHEQSVAGERINVWLDDPIGYSDELMTLIAFLQGDIVLGNPEDTIEKNERIRARSIWIYHSTATAAERVFSDLSIKKTDLSEQERHEITAALHLLDTIASQIYHGSGALKLKDKGRESIEILQLEAVHQRFLKELGPTLEVLGKVGHPAVTHHLLQTLECFMPVNPKAVFNSVALILLGGGAAGGYQYESLGAGLFVKLVQRYLADYRSMLLEDETSRKKLIEMINLFVKAGWPEARRLIYDLPSMLR